MIYLDALPIVDSNLCLFKDSREILAAESYTSIVFTFHFLVDVLEDDGCHPDVFFVQRGC